MFRTRRIPPKRIEQRVCRFEARDVSTLLAEAFRAVFSVTESHPVPCNLYIREDSFTGALERWAVSE